MWIALSANHFNTNNTEFGAHHERHVGAGNKDDDVCTFHCGSEVRRRILLLAKDGPDEL